MTALELIKVLQLKREAAVRAMKAAEIRGDTNERQFQAGVQSAFLTAENIVRHSQSHMGDQHD